MDLTSVQIAGLAGLDPIRPPASRANEAAEWWDLHLVEQVPEEGRLGQDLQVQERRGRLQRDRLQRLQTVKPARRVDIEQRDGEHQAPRHRGEPSLPDLAGTGGTMSHDMVGVVDCLEERFQVRRGPRLLGSGHQHERMPGTLQSLV